MAKQPSPTTRPSRLDNWTRRLAAGMSLQELRALLRGDPPTERPNPRYRAHTNSMVLHLRPRTYLAGSTWFTHTFRLGFFTAFFFVVEVITGLVLMVYYVPSLEGAYGSIQRLMGDVPFGELLRDVHRLAAEGMVIFAFLHMLRTFLTGSYKGPRSFTWLTGVLLLLLTLFLAFSGYLLPWDQLAYWAVTIGTSMVSAVPMVGEGMNRILRGSEAIGADGLLRFYLLHVVLLPLLAIVLLSVHYYRVARIHGISLPAGVEEGDAPDDVRREARRRVDFLPDLLTHEAFLVSVGLLVLLAASLFVYDAPLEHHANPMRTPLETEAPWFFLWVQGLLKLGDKAVMGVLVPVVLVIVLLAVPYIDRSPTRRLRKRPVALAASLVGLVSLVVLSYMGTANYGITIPPAAKIFQDLAPEEGTGPLHRVPFDQLAVGAYEAGQTDPAELTPELAAVFAGFQAALADAQAQDTLPEAQGFLIVEDWQQGLKRVTLRISWLDQEASTRQSQEREVYLHRDRNHQP